PTGVSVFVAARVAGTHTRARPVARGRFIGDTLSFGAASGARTDKDSCIPANKAEGAALSGDRRPDPATDPVRGAQAWRPDSSRAGSRRTVRREADGWAGGHQVSDRERADRVIRRARHV